MKPLLKWSGGKQDELEHIRQHIPEDYQLYIEPFVGGGAVFFDVQPEQAVINDIHPELVNFYKQIKEGRYQDLYNAMKDMPINENMYYYVRDGFQPENDFENAFRFYYLRKTCFRGMLRYSRQGKFNIPWGRYSKINCEDLKDINYHQLLSRTTVLNKDFEDIFQEYNDPNNFCFIDQPYDSVFTDYGYCQFNREDQERLAKCFKETSIKCLMIVGETDFIKQLYDGYIVGSYFKKYKFKIHSGRIKNEIDNNHLIIKNYS